MLSLEKDFFWFVGLDELTGSYVRRFAGNGALEILDAGCGTGRLLTLLQPYGKVHGFDRSAEAVRLCRLRGLQEVDCVDLNRWAPPEEAFDLITCLDVLYHSDVEDDASILRKFHKSLKPRGHLIVNLPAFNLLWRAHDNRVHTKRRYRKTPFMNALQEAGFEVTCATYRLPVLFLGILLTKVLRSDVQAIPSGLNRFLLALHRLENRFIAQGGRLPFGSSLFIIGRKP